jgi:glutathione-disulfide reductase
MKLGHGFPSVGEWISQNLPKGKKIGFDPALVSAASAKAKIKAYSEKGYEFVPISENLVNKIWENRPEMSKEKVFIHELQYTGASVAEKLESVLKNLNTNFLFTSVLDDIAWLLNLRGKDIEYNPLFFSYLLIDKSLEPAKLTLFVNENKVSEIQDYLLENNITVLGYEEAVNYIKTIEYDITIDHNELNYLLYQNFNKPVHQDNVIARIKAIKNPREIRGFRESHIRDAVAMTIYLSWLDSQVKSGADLDEWTAALELDRLRAAESLNMGLSFENISSSGPNAAIIHYAPTAETARKLTWKEIYLLDSGGQYLDGTIDTTRTLHFGRPTEREKECFTRVLLGNLDLERVKWPKSSRITGNDLDVIARKRLWEVGLDYNHGTGHGVGYFLNVHEGPHSLCLGSQEVLKAGMNITNEPGYYEEGIFGIRIENVLLVVESSTVPEFLEFENVTMVPYDRNLLLKSLLSNADIEYIDQYHKKIFNTIGPILLERNETLAYDWLKKATEPVLQITKTYDYLVIGAGSGGLASARRAAKYGKKVAIIEGQDLGGTCVNLGCVPKKVMWNAANLIEDMKVAQGYGIDFTYQASFGTLKKNRDSYIARLNNIYKNNLLKEGVDLIRGWGYFESSNTIRVNSDVYSAEHILIATGSKALIPECPGKEFFYTSDDFFKLENAPEKVLIVGNGYIAVEIAGVFISYGVDTTILIRNEQLLRTFDKDLGEVLRKVYSSYGIKFIESDEVLSISKSGNNLLVKTNTTSDEYSCVFSAIGRVSNFSELNLDKINLNTESGYIHTDEWDNTSVPGIYAVGDVTNKPKLTPVAIAAGRKLSDRLFGNKVVKMDYENIASVIFSHPPIGTIGLSEAEARSLYSDVKVYKTQFNSMFYAVSDHKITTFLKLIVVGENEKIVGLHGIGRGIDEMIQGFSVAIKMGATKKDFDRTIAIHPTVSEEFVTLT